MSRPFYIKLSPIRSDATLDITRDGETLLVNGHLIDCSGLTETMSLSAQDIGCELLVSDIVVIDDAFHLTLLYPHGPDAKEADLYPLPLLLTEDEPSGLENIAAEKDEAGL